MKRYASGFPHFPFVFIKKVRISDGFSHLILFSLIFSRFSLNFPKN